MDRRKGPAKIVDHVQCLGDDHTIEAASLDRLFVLEIDPDGGVWIGRLRGIDYVRAHHPFAAKSVCVRVVPNLRDTPPDILGMTVQETLDVVAVNRRAAIAAKCPAEWLDLGEIPELDRSWRWY